MLTGFPAVHLRETPSTIRDDRFTRCPFPAATTHASVALARSSNTAMEHQNCCTDLRHPELLAACFPYSSVHGKLVVQHPSRTKKVGKLPPLRSFSFLTLRGASPDWQFRSNSGRGQKLEWETFSSEIQQRFASRLVL